MPEAAVTCAGQLSVSMGSTIATLGMRKPDETPCFTFSFSLAKMAIAVTSEPVPAVVGTAMIGRPLRGTSSTPTMSSTDASLSTSTDVILATSIAEPPPKPMMQS